MPHIPAYNKQTPIITCTHNNVYKLYKYCKTEHIYTYVYLRKAKFVPGSLKFNKCKHALTFIFKTRYTYMVISTFLHFNSLQRGT